MSCWHGDIFVTSWNSEKYVVLLTYEATRPVQKKSLVSICLFLRCLEMFGDVWSISTELVIGGSKMFQAYSHSNLHIVVKPGSLLPSKKSQRFKSPRPSITPRRSERTSEPLRFTRFLGRNLRRFSSESHIKPPFPAKKRDPPWQIFHSELTLCSDSFWERSRHGKRFREFKK